MPYVVKEIFYTLQGEGANTGRAAVFCRFSGCNLWNGLEESRNTAICKFCDTDFVGTGADGGKFATASELAREIDLRWTAAVPSLPRRFVVFTGGEPLLQLDDALIQAVRSRGFEIAVETNGTLRAPGGISWLCVSPKAGAPLTQRSGSELKLVFPQAGLDPAALEQLAFEHFFLQPMAGPDLDRNTRLAVEYCLTHPRWRLSLQTHKLLGIR